MLRKFIQSYYDCPKSYRRNYKKDFITLLQNLGLCLLMDLMLLYIIVS